jgi:DNA-binding FrmR family transcriptional regulator
MPRGIPRNKSVQHAILHRYQIALGHLTKVITMVQGGCYCMDCIHQSQAVQSALKSADQILMVNHLQTCVADAVKKGNTKEVIKEVIQIMDKNTCCGGKCDCKECKCDCVCCKDGKCNCKDGKCECKDGKCTCSK